MILLLLLALNQEPPIDWQRAEHEIVRLVPSAFTSLPHAITGELERRGCTIPQTWDDQRPHNVERGHFLSSKATDWIVLCSTKGKSSILVFRSGAQKPIARIQECGDAVYLQGTLPGRAGFSRRIRAIYPEDIRGYCKLWQHDCPAITHDGIEDIFEDKASSILYFSGTKWLTLPGAD